MLSNRNKDPLPVGAQSVGFPAWASARGRNGVPQEGAVGDLAGTSGAPLAPPLGTGQVCKLLGEDLETVPLAPSQCLSFSRPPKGRVPGNPFLGSWEISPAPATSLPGSF